MRTLYKILTTVILAVVLAAVGWGGYTLLDWQTIEPVYQADNLSAEQQELQDSLLAARSAPEILTDAGGTKYYCTSATESLSCSESSPEWWDDGTAVLTAQEKRDIAILTMFERPNWAFWLDEEVQIGEYNLFVEIIVLSLIFGLVMGLVLGLLTWGSLGFGLVFGLAFGLIWGLGLGAAHILYIIWR